VGVQVCLQINGQGGVARDRASLHPEVETTETGFPTVREFREPSTKLEFDGFYGITTDGE